MNDIYHVYEACDGYWWMARNDNHANIAGPFRDETRALAVMFEYYN